MVNMSLDPLILARNGWKRVVPPVQHRSIHFNAGDSVAFGASWKIQHELPLIGGGDLLIKAAQILVFLGLGDRECNRQRLSDRDLSGLRRTFRNQERIAGP